ncbi:MAG: hypothetical protein OXL37_03560 [Chloroflexota bacterium]|nr:hypothetical protein [Chloroflexota bacterium]MDE2958606.1 hypothetical protein [Chloroflexota bacterium]
MAADRGKWETTARRKTILNDELTTRKRWTIAATTGHRSLVGDREKRRRMNTRYSGNFNWPVWFASFPAEPASPNLLSHSARQRSSQRPHRREAVSAHAQAQSLYANR